MSTLFNYLVYIMSTLNKNSKNCLHVFLLKKLQWFFYRILGTQGACLKVEIQRLKVENFKLD